MLEAANRASATAWIYLDKRFLGELKSGARRRFYGVTPGAGLLEYRFPPDPRVFSHHVTLQWGRVLRIEIARGGDRLHPVPAPFGVVVLRNDSPVDLVVSLGNRKLGTVLARDSRRFDDIPSGTHVIIARDFKRHVHQRQRVRVRVDSVLELELMPKPAILLVENRTKEPLEIYHGETLIGTVPKTSTRRFRGLLTGAQELRAIGRRTKSVHRLKTDIRPGMTHPWRISSASSSIVVENRTAETLRFSVDGHVLTMLAPGKRVEMDNIHLGPHRLTVVGTTSGNRQIRKVELNAAERMRWVIRHLASGVVVVNHTRWTIELYDDGLQSASLKPGVSRVIDLKGRPSVSLEVRIPDGRLRLRRTFVAKNSEVERWVISAPTATMRLVNRTPNTLEIVVNKRSMGIVAPKRDARLALTVGRNDIILIERGSGVRYPKRVLVQPGHHYRWSVEPKLGGLRVENQSGETVELSLGDRSLVTIPHGESRIFPNLSRGKVTVRARGLRTGAEHTATRTIVAEKRLLWKIVPEYGDLTIDNQLIDAVRFRVGERDLGLIASRQKRVFRLPVGTHRLSVWRAGKSDLRRTHVTIKSLGTHRWEIREESARLAIYNGTDEDLEVRLEDKYLGVVHPHRTARFENLVFRPLSLTAIGVQSHTRYMTQKTLKPHGLFRWEILPAVGSVAIHNKLTEALIVEVDDLKATYRIAPGSTKRILVPVGRRRLLVRGETTLNVARYRRTIYEGHVQRFEFERWNAFLRIDNRLDESVIVTIDGRREGTILPKSARVFSRVPSGSRLVMVRSASGRHDRRRIFNFANDSHHWLLQ
ncbi:MAG: hypothetical protein KC609_20235 [Myxococcales bacterium]|nr:hypothetical protein [Myxococcales bacterium]